MALKIETVYRQRAVWGEGGRILIQRSRVSEAEHFTSPLLPFRTILDPQSYKLCTKTVEHSECRMARTKMLTKILLVERQETCEFLKFFLNILLAVHPNTIIVFLPT